LPVGRHLLGLLLVLVGARLADAHPLGNFSIDHYSRIRVTAGGLQLRYVIDMAEIPTMQELLEGDVNRDGEFSDGERHKYLGETVRSLASRLLITLNGTPLSWHVRYSNLTAPLRVSPSGSPANPATLRLLVDLSASFDPGAREEHLVRFEDGNYPGRTGWKEMVVEVTDPIRMLRSTASAKDLSLELRRYPPDIAVPPQELTAEFVFTNQRATWLGAARHSLAEQFPLAVVMMLATAMLVYRWRAGRKASR
jgi:hypothetical protein